MRTLLILPLILAAPAIAQSAPPDVTYGAQPGSTQVNPVNVAVPVQQQTTIYPVQLPQTIGPAAPGSRCSITAYGQQTTGQALVGGVYTIGGSVSCPL